MPAVDTTPSMLPAALWWARHGIPIFPAWWPTEGRCACPQGGNCHSPGKHPLTANGLHDASNDESVIREWWTRWPHANIAVPTGTHFDVVDIDGAHQAWGEFTKQHGTPQHVGIAISGRPSGGLHLFCTPGGQKTVPSGKRNLPTGVEIKGAGGYVIAPPSLHVSGRTYTWVRSIDVGEITGDIPWDQWYDTVTNEPNPTPPKTPLPLPATTSADRFNRYGKAVLQRAIDTITQAGEGGRWNALALEAAPLVARAIAGGCLTRTEGQRALEDACRTAGLARSEEARVPELLDRLEQQGITNPIAPPLDTSPQPVDQWAGLIPTTPLPAQYEDQVSELIERTSWWPRDLGGVISGNDPEPDPAYLHRDDGNALFYPGKVNGLIGESESGKTWIALLAVTQALKDHTHVLYLDFEDTAPGIITRLTAMGATTQQLQHLTYISPDETLHSEAHRDLTETLTQHNPRLIIIDGFNAAMTLLGLDLNSNTDATAFSQRLLKPLANTGACVIYVDHVPKNKEARGKGGIGAQAKRAMTTGCAITVDITAPFGRGMTGKLRLTIDKDRPGKIRAISQGARYAGEAILDSHDTGNVTVHIAAPDTRTPEERGPWRPTKLMQKVSEFLHTMPEGASGKTIEDAINGKSAHIRTAIERLVIEGYVAREQGKRGAIIHTLTQPYEEEFDFSWDGTE